MYRSNIMAWKKKMYKFNIDNKLECYLSKMKKFGKTSCTKIELKLPKHKWLSIPMNLRKFNISAQNQKF